MNARLIALQILMKLEKQHSNSSLLLRQVLMDVSNPADRSFVTELVLGTLRWQLRLEHFIQHYSRRPLHRIDPRVNRILQIGIYQLITPGFSAHAAIHETVELCRIVKMSSAKAFVNGILRNVQRDLPNLSESDDPSVRWSHPGWLVERWIARFGKNETEDLLRANNERPPLMIRVNELKTSAKDLIEHLQAEGIEVSATNFGAAMLEVTSGAPQFSQTFANGEFYIQDASIQILGTILDGTPGSRVLEIASAPGGKTLQLAIHMQNEGMIIAIDADLKRMQQWKENILRLGIRCAHPIVSDARQLALNAKFDRIVIDAPCSSLGVLRRHPEIKWWRRAEHLSGLHKLQLEILERSAQLLLPGASLVYSVCSFEPEETSNVIDAFIASQPQFSLQHSRYLYPHRDSTDGFFIAELKLSALAV